MKIKLSKAQYIKLIEIVYLGNWLANSSRGVHETIEDYEQIQQHIFSYAKQFDVGDDVLQQHGTKYYASLEVEERLGTLVDEYESEAFWGNLASKLSFRDLFREIGPLNQLTDETMQRKYEIEEAYIEEFSENGLKNVVVANVASGKTVSTKVAKVAKKKNNSKAKPPTDSQGLPSKAEDVGRRSRANLVTIDDVLAQFLLAQQQRLKPRTYHDYETVIDLFHTYLNTYGPNRIFKEELALWEEVAKFNSENAFTATFGPDKIDSSAISEFLSYFMIRKVMASESLLKDSGRVMNKLVKWLREQNIIDEEHYSDSEETIAEVKDDLPLLERTAQLIFEHSDNTPALIFNEMEEDYFYIAKTEPGELWVENFSGDSLIGPVTVTKQISDLCKPGWSLYLQLGKSDNKWYILESGNVYPN